MPLCRTVSTYCSAPKGTFAPPLRLAGLNMQGKRLYTAASPEFSKRKRPDVAIRIGPVPTSVNSGALPYKNGVLITRPNLTNCILPRTAMGGHCNGAVTEGENGWTSGSGDFTPPPPTCTEGTSTGQDSSVTVLSDEARLVCPEVAVHFSGTLLSSRVGVLSVCQTGLEARLTKLQQKLRQKQLLLVHHHARSQLKDRSPGPSDPAHLPGRTSHVIPQQSACGPLPLGGERGGGVCAQLNHRLKLVVKMVDNEMTDVSSEEEKEEEDGEEEDEDEEEGSCEEVKERWEQARMTIGSQWVWLEHKIAELNAQICQLDNTLQRRPTKEPFTFVTSDVSPGLCYPSNGSLKVMGGAPLNHRQILPNGYVGQHHQLPHLLLPDGVLGAKLQVKDLLCASLTRTFPALMEEEGYSAARTSRPLDRRARRKVIRIPSVPMTTREKCIETPHPHLSRPEDCPSRLWLDAVMSYTAAYPLTLTAASSHKRRKCVGSDTERASAYSTSVLSGDTPTQTRGRKRHYSSQLSLQFDSSPVPSVASPGGHLDAPASAQPLASGRKKRVLTAPAFDIDNIVIPYSVAASTRPEKLEYKEIVTPSWRVVETSEPLPPLPPPPMEQVLLPPVENGEEVEVCPRRSHRMVGKRDGGKRPKSAQDEEVTSDEAYLSRHERCEEQEKKRFFNFVTGSNRKRRPVSLTSDGGGGGGGGGVGSPVPIAERSKRKGYAMASPTCSEPDYVGTSSPQVVPWICRKFPLIGDDLDALDNPPPPPPRLSSPLFPLTVIPIEPLPTKPHNSNSCSVPDTPLSSPLTPAATTEEVCVSSLEWEVSNPPAAGIPLPPKEVSVAPTTPEDSPIILKLTKRS